VRLSPQKIEYVADKILKLIQDNQRVHILSNVDLVQRSVADTIYANMKTEEEIDEEVDILLSQHRGEIEAMEMNLGMLRAKMKREIAKKRDFTL
jgi:hypothetical protein